MPKEKFERIVQFTPAFDKTSIDPTKNYGIGSMLCWLYLKGVFGVVQFQFNTGIYLPHNMKQIYASNKNNLFTADGWDLGYHSYKPLYEGQQPLTDKCSLLENGPCYYDGSSLNGQEVFKILVEKGSDAVWEFLENYYYKTFGELYGIPRTT